MKNTIRAILVTSIIMIGSGSVGYSEEKTWNNLAIAPENRCAPYVRRDYSYNSKIEPRIIEYSDIMNGIIYAPYSNITLDNFKQTDIDHIVSLSEAHDSGLCDASLEEKRSFANDLLNLTLATPKVNRYQKSSKDINEWYPENNKCWFLNRVIKVKQKYNLTIDNQEADTMKELHKECECN